MNRLRRWFGTTGTDVPIIAFLTALLVVACVLAIAGCGPRPVALTTQSASQPAATVQGDGVVLKGARAFAAAELAYITAADAVGRLTDVGFIHGAGATRARELNSKAQAALITGKAATTAAAQAGAAAQLFGLADALDLLSGRKS